MGQKYPKVLTEVETKKVTQENKSRLMTICDISCDVNGTIELIKKISTINNPFYFVDILEFKTQEEFSTINTNSILCNAVDDLPDELP